MAASLPAPIARPQDRRFYRGMSLLITAIVFAGFSRTFYLSPWLHGPALSPLRIVHGVALLRLDSAVRDADDPGRRPLAADFIAGLASRAPCSRWGWSYLGSVLAVWNAREGRAPPGVPPLPFLIIPLFDMLVFAPLVAAAVWYRRRPETHKRLMLLATVSLLDGGPSRGFRRRSPQRGRRSIFGVVDLLILTAVLYDIITRRKVHPVYVWGGLAILASQVIRLALSGTSAWLTVAAWLTSG